MGVISTSTGQMLGDNNSALQGEQMAGAFENCAATIGCRVVGSKEEAAFLDWLNKIRRIDGPYDKYKAFIAESGLRGFRITSATLKIDIDKIDTDNSGGHLIPASLELGPGLDGTAQQGGRQVGRALNAFMVGYLQNHYMSIGMDALKAFQLQYIGQSAYDSYGDIYMEGGVQTDPYVAFLPHNVNVTVQIGLANRFVPSYVSAMNSGVIFQEWATPLTKGGIPTVIAPVLQVTNGPIQH